MLLRKEKDESEVTRHINQLNGKQAVEFARYLIADQNSTDHIKLPEALEEKILKHKLVSPLISIFLHNECNEVISAVEYLQKYSDQGAINCMVETDLNLLVKVLQIAKEVLVELS